VDDEPAEALIVLIRRFQVQHVRLIDDMSRLRLNDGVHLIVLANVRQAIRDAAEVYALASTLFPFARGDSLDRLGPSHIKNALYIAGCFSSPEIDALTAEWQREIQVREELGSKTGV